MTHATANQLGHVFPHRYDLAVCLHVYATGPSSESVVLITVGLITMVMSKVGDLMAPYCLYTWQSLGIG